jgi:hypothetical protein
MTHPITPSPEEFAEWLAKAKSLHPDAKSGFIAGEVARLAYQAGADLELEECIHWLITGPYGASIACNADHMIGDLRAARRPKPPSLKKQALRRLLDLERGADPSLSDYDTIRRALEQLDD